MRPEPLRSSPPQLPPRHGSLDPATNSTPHLNSLTPPPDDGCLHGRCLGRMRPASRQSQGFDSSSFHRSHMVPLSRSGTGPSIFGPSHSRLRRPELRRRRSGSSFPKHGICFAPWPGWCLRQGRTSRSAAALFPCPWIRDGAVERNSRPDVPMTIPGER